MVTLNKVEFYHFKYYNYPIELVFIYLRFKVKNAEVVELVDTLP